MSITVNSVVEKMNGYLPFDANHSNIYEEYQTADNAIELRTVALKYLSSLYSSGATIAILTGDAGHGKTHVCRKFLQETCGYSETDARLLILNDCDGSTIIEDKTRSDRRALKIYKDLSELSESDSVEALKAACSEDNCLTIICVNEGKLRAVLAAGHDTAECQAIDKELNTHFNAGVTSSTGQIHIVNLNFQSVAATNGDSKSLISQAIKSWMDGRKWTACNNCSVQENCPIFHNFKLLGEAHPSTDNNRINRIEQLLAATEQLGEVITIREMLMLVSYIVTGGLSCADVHKRKNKIGWQNEYAFYNLLFKAPSSLSSEALKAISILNKLSKLDPGLVSDRIIDESLLNSLGLFAENQLDLKFYYSQSESKLVDAANGVDEIIGNPESKKDRQLETELTIKIVRALRRRAYFEAKFEEIGATGQLGFQYGQQFHELLLNRLKGSHLIKVKRRIINGLHTIQGIANNIHSTALHLVDPAFGGSTQHAAIISRTIQAGEIKLVPMREKWQSENDSEQNPIYSSVDWIDRYVCLRIKDVEGNPRDFPLDLFIFNTICVAADGFVSENFFTHDLRRVKNYLATLCVNDPAQQSEIKVIVDGMIRSVSIDYDSGVIQVGGSA